MLYSNRVYFMGQDSPIGFNTGEVMHGLMEAYGTDNVLFIEDMEMRPSLDLFIHAIKIGITYGVDGLFFSYIGKTEGVHSYSIVDPALGADDEVYSELEIRRRMQKYYSSRLQELSEDLKWMQEILVGE